MDINDFDTAFIDALDLTELEWFIIDNYTCEAYLYYDGIEYKLTANYKMLGDLDCQYELNEIKALYIGNQ